MDPNATLIQMLGATSTTEALERAIDLLTWLSKGGAHPYNFAQRMDQESTRMLDRLEASEA